MSQAMLPTITLRRNTIPGVLVVLLLFTIFLYRDSLFGVSCSGFVPQTPVQEHEAPVAFNWANVKPRYSVTSIIPLPSAPVQALPRLQHPPAKPTGEAARIRNERLQAVKAEFVHAWTGYRKHAWLQDEVAPLSGGYNNPFGGWAASLVDALGGASIIWQ